MAGRLVVLGGRSRDRVAKALIAEARREARSGALTARLRLLLSSLPRAAAAGERDQRQGDWVGEGAHAIRDPNPGSSARSSQRHKERQNPARPRPRPTAMFFARRPTLPVRTARPVAEILAAR